MLRLAAKLGAERVEQLPAQKEDARSSQDSFRPAKPLSEDAQDFIRDGREKVQEPVPLPPAEHPRQTESNSTTNGSKRRGKGKKKSTETKQTANQRFQTKNMFDYLRELTLNPETENASSSADDDSAQPPGDVQTSTWDEKQDEPAGSWENEVFVQDKTGWVPIEQAQRQAMEFIPAFDSEFWQEFGNKLRVFGTQEAVLKIADW